MNFAHQSFIGYPRPGGGVGTRNHLGIISVVTCANQAAEEIAKHVPGAAVFTHQQGCGLVRPDMDMVEKTLINLGRNPNLGAVIVVRLGCEGVDVDKIAEGIACAPKPVEVVRIQQEGGYFGAIAEAGRKAQMMAREISGQPREAVGIENLRLGIKCGASDPTSGLSSNPGVGAAVDRLLEAGGSVVFGETPEIIGAEHILTRRAADPSVKDRIYEYIEAFEKRLWAAGGDMRGGNPSTGNIRAGLTTIEEKSLGAIVKSGTKPIDDVFGYGECPPNKPGLFFVDSPGREPELLAGMAAAGAQVLLFSTGIGAPQGFPFVPVVKVSGNRNTVKTLADFIDVDVSAVIHQGMSLEEAGDTILKESLEVASGKSTKAEVIGYVGSTAIYKTGPAV